MDLSRAVDRRRGAEAVPREVGSMAGDDRDYHSLAVSSWDLWRDDTATWSDRVVYRDVVERFGQPVLDLCCASGRLVLEYLADGIAVEGLDGSAEMLDLVRAKAAARGLPAPTLHQQALEELALPRRYRTILGASSAIQLVTAPGAAEAVMRRIVDHLEPGGAFAGSFAFEWRPGEPLDTGWELLFERDRPGDGATVRSWTREWREPETRRWHAEQRFEVERDGEVVATEEHRRSPEGRWYAQAQAIELLEGAGLVDVELFSGFSHEPAGVDERLFWALGVRPG
jgi:SAM-dependent methyltransferase